MMQLDVSSFRRSERTALLLRTRLEGMGYHKYRMGRFEEYSLYQQYENFLSSAQVITFTDLDGRLLALKPDVTLSIAKNAQPAPGECKKYYYQENVYRPSRESHTFQEINQMGVECIGAVDGAVVGETIRLAVESLAMTNAEHLLELSHMGFVTGLLDAIQAPQRLRARLMACLRDKKAHEIETLAQKGELTADGAAALIRLMTLSGEPDRVLASARAQVLNTRMQAALDELEQLTAALENAPVRIDLSQVGEMEYYNGIFFTGYLNGLPRPVLQGGRYDLLAQQFCPNVGAIGFALYLDELERLDAQSQKPDGKRVMLNVALPKGRLGDRVYDLLAGAGYGCPENYHETRKLVVENPEAGIRYFLVKPSDVAVYVEHGAADIGIVGKDILVESGADVYELLDTGLGRCDMSVAGRKDFTDDESRPLRVATKFVNIAKAHYAQKGRAIDIIKLNGSIELAPILGLSDVIVDIVETGTTLKENNLTVIEKFMPISARFIANKSASKFKEKELQTLLEKLKKEIDAR